MDGYIVGVYLGLAATTFMFIIFLIYECVKFFSEKPPNQEIEMS